MSINLYYFRKVLAKINLSEQCKVKRFYLVQFVLILSLYIRNYFWLTFWPAKVRRCMYFWTIISWHTGIRSKFMIKMR